MLQKTSWFTKGRRAQTVDDYETWIQGGVVPTLNAFDNGDVRATVLIVENNRRDGAVAQTSIVRRLTPTECERLQGFPDGWTDEQADSHRYKQMGNAVAVPVVDWIVKNLVSTHHNG